MKQIPLTQNQYAMVDDGDYDWLNRYKWCAARHRYTFYAVRGMRIDGGLHHLRMHRLILGLAYRDGRQTDHIDRNGLNNQRSNLRICSNSENAQNRCSRPESSSQYKGVHWHKGNKSWQAFIRFNGKQKTLGYFRIEVEAALVYNRAARELFGEYARLNETGEEKK